MVYVGNAHKASDGSRLVKQARGNVTHVGFFELVVFATHFVDANIFECSDDSLNVESHGNETIYEVLVISMISAVELVLGTGNHSKIHTLLA